MTRGDVWVVVPAFNEARSLPSVIEGVCAQGFRLVCVDDGSSDATAEIALAAGADLLVHPANIGQGAAIQTGVDYALRNRADLICTLDADGQHDPADLPRMIAALEASGADFALGSRFLDHSPAMPPRRRALLRAATWFTRLTTGLAVTDTHNGLRVMTRRGAERIHLRQNGMAHASEILEQIGSSGLKMIEVPVTISYSDYSLTKGQRSVSAIRVLADLAAGRLHS